MIDFKKARKRNVILKIAKKCLEKNIILNSFKEDEIKNEFYFKEKDIKDYLKEIFVVNNDKFLIKEEFRKVIEEYLSKSNKLQNIVEIEKKFINQYDILNECFTGIRVDNKKYDEVIGETIKNAVKLHWIHLPIYSEQMIINRGIIPEENIEEYYNHYHAIQDLYFEIVGRGIDYKNIGGDCNLDKEFTVNIYTSRWGHDDMYEIKRTVEGWHLSFLSYTGNFDKNGEGMFFEALNHDSVFFPKDAVGYALNTLWDEADSTSMDSEELKYKFLQIINWINEIEKASKKFQPDWCNYF